MGTIDNHRIAKNTLFLYLRMILTIVVNLYTVRVIWRVLGVEDYGVYNVVGGIVLMFSFLNNAMVASSQRFISFELGIGDNGRLNKVFSISVLVHGMLAIVVLLLAETIGLWFLNVKLNIPPSRLTAANWVYQCSVLAFMITIISVPYNACIVAHEHMKVYGYFGILEVLLKLLIVFLLILIPFDKLITYSILVLGVSGFMRLIYGLYCKKHFDECRYRFTSDHHLMKDMFSFAGWSFIGNLGFSVRDQGLNIILNLFFNVAVNAAKGIASQIGNVISGFSQSFQMAVNPQITKRFAAGETESMMSLVFTGSKFSAMLMMFIVIPLFFASGPVLKLWLGDVAPYTVGFLQLTLIMGLIDSMVGPVTTALQATGRIKCFQILVSIIMLSNIPSAYVWLRFDHNPFIVLYVSIITSGIALITRILLLRAQIPFSYKHLLSYLFFRVIMVMVISFLITGFIYHNCQHDFWGLIVYITLSVIAIAFTSFVLGLERNEKKAVIKIIKRRTSF